MSTTQGADTNYDALLSQNATRVFSERDQAKRLAALSELWAPNGILYEEGKVIVGIDAISRAIGTLLDSLPPAARFAPDGVAVGHHGLGRLRWRAVDGSGKPMPVSGTDIAFIEEGRITTLYVLLDPVA